MVISMLQQGGTFMNKNKIAIIGTGTGGLLSINHFCTWLDSSWEVTSIYDPNIDIIGVGESTTPRVPYNLFLAADFSFAHDADKIDATIKHYVKYSNWRNHDITSLIDTSVYGIHFNNFKLRDFLFDRLKLKWGNKFKIKTGKVEELYNLNEKVLVNVDGEKLIYDYVVDCRGYPEDYSEYVVSEYLPLNHCLVHVIDEPGDWEFTHHKATKNGWMFGIPLKTRQSWGYLYNDTISSKEECIEDISEIFGVDKDSLSLKEFKFKPYYAKKILDGRILKNGNRFLFFEPIEALSTYYYDEANKFFYDYIKGEYTEQQINETFNIYCKFLETFICYIYHGGSIYDTKFWRFAKEKCLSRLYSDEYFESIVDHFRANADNLNNASPIKPFNSWQWKKFDEQFGYNYFVP